MDTNWPDFLFNSSSVALHKPVFFFRLSYYAFALLSHYTCLYRTDVRLARLGVGRGGSVRDWLETIRDNFRSKKRWPSGVCITTTEWKSLLGPAKFLIENLIKYVSFSSTDGSPSLFLLEVMVGGFHWYKSVEATSKKKKKHTKKMIFVLFMCDWTLHI